MDDSQPLSLLSSSGPRVVSYKISTGVTVWESRSSESESESDGTNGGWSTRALGFASAYRYGAPKLRA